MNLSGNKILITGGSSGIGLELASRLSTSGNEVIIVGRDREKLKEASMRARLHTFSCNLQKEADIGSLMDAVHTQHPDINILINNAGIQNATSFLHGASLPIIQSEIDINLTAAIKLCAAFIPYMKHAKEAAIVNISSSLHISPKKSTPVYCATKAGIHSFTKALRYQLSETNIKVFEVVPPLIDTPMTQGRGKNKLSTKDFANEFLRCFESDTLEMNIGKAKLLKILHRISPKAADRLLMNH